MVLEVGNAVFRALTGWPDSCPEWLHEHIKEGQYIEWYTDQYGIHPEEAETDDEGWDEMSLFEPNEPEAEEDIQWAARASGYYILNIDDGSDRTFLCRDPKADAAKELSPGLAAEDKFWGPVTRS